MGISKAKELIFTAKVITGQEALEIGLVEHVVEQNSDSNAAYLKALEIAKEIQTKVGLVLHHCVSHDLHNCYIST